MGFDTNDDAAVYRVDNETAIIQSVDLFPPVVDDPYDYGAIAAANALSDIYAMGGTPTLALNILCIPSDMDADVVKRILEGGYDKVKEAGAVIGGGHSIRDEEPKYGLCVTGLVHPNHILKNNTPRAGDILILTKPLGSGILTTAAKSGLLPEREIKPLVRLLAQLNKAAAEIIKPYNVSACTDVTGFGLLGHAFEMIQDGTESILLDSAKIPLLPHAHDMAQKGIIPGGAYTNRDWLLDRVDIAPTVPLDLSDIFFDPQTSGGLLFSVSHEDAERCLDELKKTIPYAEKIGHVEKKLADEHPLYVL